MRGIYEIGEVKGEKMIEKREMEKGEMVEEIIEGGKNE